MPKADATGLAPEKSAEQNPPALSSAPEGFLLFAAPPISMVKSRSGGLGHSNAKTARRALQILRLLGPGGIPPKPIAKLRNSPGNNVRISGGKSVTRYKIHDSYMALQKVERDFRTMKTGLLEIHPVFVRKESRTRGHVFCSMLALKLQREVERRLAAVFGTTDADRYAVTVPDALAALSRLTLLHYKVDDKIAVTKLPMPDQQQQRILDALKVSLPSK